MSIFTKFSLKNRAAIIIMVLLVTVLGTYSGSKLPMEFLPSIDNPMVTVTTFGQGMDAETMTDEVTNPLEAELKNVKDIDVMTSSTSEGLSRIDIMYTSQADMKVATQEVEKVINQIQLPQGIMKPFVSQLNTSMIPIAQVAVESKKGFDEKLETMVDEEIKPVLEDVDGVANILLYGQSTTELAITLEAEKLKAEKISPGQLMMALQGQSASVPAGEISLDGKTNAVRVLGEIKDVKQIEDIMLTPEVSVKDVADVSIDQYYEAESRIDGKEALTLVITKEASENAVQIGKEIERKVEDLHNKYEDTIEIRILSSTAEQVEGAVLGMAKEVGIGALAASVIILLFLRNVRTTLIAVISIPLSILITLFLLDLSDITLNILTLGGLAVAVGRLVDDSIVVIENIYRRIQTEGRSAEVIIDATKEVAIAITSSTLTTIAVFLPIGLISGAIGEFMMPMVLTVVYSILASLLVALTVVPLMSFGLLKNIKNREEKPSKRYLSLLSWSLNHKLVILGLSLIIFVGSIVAFVTIPQAAVSSEDESMTLVTLTFPADYDSALAEEKAEKLENQFIKEDKIKDVYFRMGSATEDARWGQTTKANEASFYVMFEKGKDVDAFIDSVKELSDEYKPAEITASKGEFGGFGSGNGIELNVTATNEEELVKSSEKLIDELKAIEGLEKVKSNYEELKNEWVVEVDQEKAQSLGFSSTQVGNEVRALLTKSPIGELKVAGKSLPTSLSYDEKEFTNREDFLKSYIFSPVAGPVQLKEVASVSNQDIKTQVYHKDGEETIQVTASITGEDLKGVGAEVNKILTTIDLPDGASVEFAGATESMQENFMDLFKIMGIAIVVVYLIMVITFGGARVPFAILFSLPLAAVGGVLGLLVSRTPVDMNALIGALMLIGIVVTNAIVLIERVQQSREQGMTTREALLDAGAIRLRPIIMTAITTIVAMMPLVFSSSEAGSMVSRSLAVVVIGGLTVSTALTLVVVPVMYELLDRIGKKKKKKQNEIKKTEEISA